IQEATALHASCRAAAAPHPDIQPSPSSPSSDDGQRFAAVMERLMQQDARREQRQAAQQRLTRLAMQWPRGVSPKEQQQRVLAAGGAYIVQVLDRCNTFKIGKAIRLGPRIVGLEKVFGPLACIALFPHDEPTRLERALHARFAPFRLYN